MAVKENGTMMNRVKREFCLRTAGFLAGIFAFVWWCILYPELCFPQDTYEAVYEDGVDWTEENCPTTKSCQTKESCLGLLQADEERVIVESRLLEWLERHRAE